MAHCINTSLRQAPRIYPDEMLVERLELALQTAIQNGVIVGADVAVARNGKMVFHRQAGYADREQRRPVDGNSLFRIASMTKLITSCAVMVLHERSLLDLQEPICRWLPQFRPRLPDGSCPSITIHQLLSHTAGLSYGFEQGADSSYRKAGVSDGLDLEPVSHEKNLQRLCSVPLLYRPGEAWQYSLATDVLGVVIERITDMPLPQAVAQLVTEPLGMNDTCFCGFDSGRLSVAYVDGPSGPSRMRQHETIQLDSGLAKVAPARSYTQDVWASGGSGMVGNTIEYLHLLETLRTERGLLKPESARAILSNVIGDIPVPSRGSGWGFGLGTLVLTDPKAAGSIQGKGTWTWGGLYGGHYWVDPLAQISLVALTNTAVAGLWGAFPDSLIAAIYC